MPNTKLRTIVNVLYALSNILFAGHDDSGGTARKSTRRWRATKTSKSKVGQYDIGRADSVSASSRRARRKTLCGICGGVVAVTHQADKLGVFRVHSECKSQAAAVFDCTVTAKDACDLADRIVDVAFQFNGEKFSYRFNARYCWVVTCVMSMCALPPALYAAVHCIETPCLESIVLSPICAIPGRLGTSFLGLSHINVRIELPERSCVYRVHPHRHRRASQLNSADALGEGRLEYDPELSGGRRMESLWPVLLHAFGPPVDLKVSFSGYLSPLRIVGIVANIVPRQPQKSFDILARRVFLFVVFLMCHGWIPETIGCIHVRSLPLHAAQDRAHGIFTSTHYDTWVTDLSRPGV